MSDKGFRFRKQKELLKLSKKINKFFKWAKQLNRHIIKDTNGKQIHERHLNHVTGKMECFLISCCLIHLRKVCTLEL